MTQSRTSKVIILLIVLLLFTWVLLENIFMNRNIKAVNKLVDEKHVVSIKDDFKEDILLILKIANVDKPVHFNSKYDSKYLNIYFLKSDSTNNPLCNKGNAIYDPSNDILLIDETIFNSEYLEEIADLGITGVKEDALYPFAWFVIAHELGHRQLKHGTNNFFDFSDKENTILEDAADLYAFNILKQLLTGSKYSERWNIFDAEKKR